jgi:cytochrome c oxidase subunit 3
MVTKAKKHSILAILITIILAFLFTILQGLEYLDAPFNISDSVFGSCFYLTTGFHGFHVIIGTIALSVSFIKIVLNHFTNTHHFGLEAAIWYWHFVDVIWIILLGSLYWWKQ